MKTIEYYGETFVGVPDWVNYVGMDSNWKVFGYEHEPYIGEESMRLPKNGSSVKFLGYLPLDWRHSLISYV